MITKIFILLGADDSDESMSEDLDEDDEDEYENFKSSLLDHALTRESVQAHKNSTKESRKKKRSYDPQFDHKLKNKATVSLQKIESSKHGYSGSLSDMFLDDSDSEYELEEIVELCEWYPPDFWRSNSKHESKIRLTDVTVNDLTVTMRESKSGNGFFSAKS